MKRLSISSILVLLMFLTCAEAAQISDMYGRSVTLPSHIVRVLGASPPVTYMLYTIDPTLLAGLNLPPDEDLRKFLRAETMKLPVIGGFGGPGRNFNPEVLMAVKPDLVIAWPPRSGALNPRVEQILASAGIPYAGVKLDAMSDYPAAYEISGRIAGSKRAGENSGCLFQERIEET